MECENCGNKNFYKEAGYYYCKECQIQSQDVQEHGVEGINEPDEDDEHEGNDPQTQKTKSFKKSRKKKEVKDENKITSWECYNYIIHGLTEELINLGANKSLKQVVRNLWLAYLEKLQVFRRGSDCWPKLQAVSSGKDAEVVYGRKNKRRRSASTKSKSSSEDLDSTTLDSSKLRYKLVKQRKDIIMAEHEELTQKSAGTSSLHNETLVSLQSSSECASTKRSLPISFNYYARKEFRRKQSYDHFKQHRSDFTGALGCHSLAYRKVSYKYRMAPHVLSPNKLYSILYLGLLINRDEVQVGDVIRFLKSGQLSFNNYDHFFPDEYFDRSLNFRNCTKNSLFTSCTLRKTTADLAKFLQVTYYVTMPDVLSLSERYCKDLNLPDAACVIVKSLISRTKMKMKFSKNSSTIPNYEGRVLSIIIFVLKVLFGLDDVTEYHLANYAGILNRSGFFDLKMFNIINWLKYIEHRNLLEYSYYFPLQYSKDGAISDPKCFLDFISKTRMHEAKLRIGKESRIQTSTKDDCTRVLKQLKLHMPSSRLPDFNPSLTPNVDYLDAILNEIHLANSSASSSALAEHFQDNSLIYLLNPLKYLTIVNGKKRPKIVNSGANDNWAVEEITYFERDAKRKTKKRRTLVTTKLTTGLEENPAHDIPEYKALCDGEIIKQNFRCANRDSFCKKMKYLEKISSDVQLDCNKKIQEKYSKHFCPCDRHWLRILFRPQSCSSKECSEFFNQFPLNFRVVFKECLKLAQQTECDLLMEFQSAELFFAFSSVFSEPKVVKDKLLKNYIDNNSVIW